MEWLSPGIFVVLSSTLSTETKEQHQKKKKPHTHSQFLCHILRNLGGFVDSILI